MKSVRPFLFSILYFLFHTRIFVLDLRYYLVGILYVDQNIVHVVGYFILPVPQTFFRLLIHFVVVSVVGLYAGDLVVKTTDQLFVHIHRMHVLVFI
jgi:hypothetical protein